MTDNGDDLSETAGSVPTGAEAPGAAAADTLEGMLADIPPEVALYFRDLLRGLEAEAGNARAQVLRERELLQSEIGRLRVFASGLKAKLVATEERLEEIRSDATDARENLAAAKSEIALLQTAVQAGVQAAGTSGRRGR